MKKIILLSCMAGAFLLSSCSYDETVESYKGNGISFRTFAGQVTKATDIVDPSSSSGTKLDGFSVYAFGDGTNNIYDFTDTYTNSGTAWGWQTGERYWPGDDTKLRFYAYNADDMSSGSVTATNIARNGSNNANIDATLTYRPATTAGEQTDLLVAYTEGQNSTTTGAGLEINFRHTLAKITVNAKNSNTAAYRVEVGGVYLRRFKTDGTLTMPSTSTSTATLAQSNWSFPSTENTTGTGEYKSMAANGGTKLTDSYQTISGSSSSPNPFMVIPQNTTAWNEALATDTEQDNNGAYFSILCRIYQLNPGDDAQTGGKLIFPRPNTTGGNTTAPDTGDYGMASVGIGANWEPGKHYTYNIEFFGNNGGAGITDPQPDPVDPADPVDPEDPEVPVVGKPLRFNVTVSGWEAANPQPGDVPMGPTN